MVRPKEMSRSQPSSLIWIESGFRLWAPLTCKLICWNAHFVHHFCRLDPWLLKALVLQATYFSSVHPLGLIGLVRFGQDLPFALQKPLYDVADSRTRELGGGGNSNQFCSRRSIQCSRLAFQTVQKLTYSCCSGYMVWDMGNSRQIAANSVARSSVHKVMMLRYEILLQLRYPK